MRWFQMLQMLQIRPSILLVALPLTLLLAGGASAVPISMNPGSVSIDAVMGSDFTLSFDGGDTSDNILNFTVQGSGGFGFMDGLPSTALAAIVFDGTTIIDAGDALGGVVTGLVGPGTGFAGALLLDAFSPSSESFFLQLASVPTTATIYSLDLVSSDLSLASLEHCFDLGLVIDKQQVRFEAAIPEPSAALVFALGLLVTRGAIRRRR